MEAYKQRVVDEKLELDAKRIKLANFIVSPVFGGVPDAEQSRLRKQRDIMEEYSEVLGERIANF